VFARVEIRCSDLDASVACYETVLAAIPIARTGDAAWSDLVLAPATEALPATRGLHVGFAAPSRAAVDAFWEAGIAAGHRDDGPPGPRPQYVSDYYGAFLTDPDGNSVEAVHHDRVRRDGAVDHLWIRVADFDAAQRWYAELASVEGWRLRRAERTQAYFRGGASGGLLAVVADERPRTEHAHFAVLAADPARAGTRRDPDGNRVELRSAPAA
jgi:catechol 2,3-dioxygenase-like lactoylglutathione lyase family enzyme